MTSHYFKHGPFEIHAGWDRPLQYHYLNVTRTDLEPNDTEDDPSNVFISLYDTAQGQVTLTEIQNILSRLKIPLPPGFIEALDSDCKRNAGNQVTHWTQSGPSHQT